MSISEPTKQQIIRNYAGRKFTFTEACEFEKMLDNSGTSLTRLKWVDSVTKKPVIIGNCS